MEIQELQDAHGLQPGNKLNIFHTHFSSQKMKVALAIQSIVSDCVARALQWAHQEKLKGFEDEDVIVTARFIELHDKARFMRGTAVSNRK